MEADAAGKIVKNCASCAHSFTMSAPGQNQGFMVCRRYPPQMAMMNMQGAVVATPQNPTGAAQAPQGVPVPIAPNWVCGEHAPAVIANG